MGQILAGEGFILLSEIDQKQAAFGMRANWLVFNTDDNGIVEKCKINEVTQVHNEFRNQYNRE